MYSLRRWLYRPKRTDRSLLAQFYFADEELNLIASELDGFEGRKDPERCAALVNQLRACQSRVLNIVSQIMDDCIKDQRALRDFRVKFPDEVIQENLAGQLWFGAECLSAGSSIMNRELESACMRPLARALTKNLDRLRLGLREQCLHNADEYPDRIKENLIIFDKLFAEFELSYVSAMVSVKTAHEYDMVQEITVLFSETVQRALQIGLLTQDMIDEYDPALMFTIPRLAIICGVLIFKDGPLNPDNDPWNISEMFKPFQTLLLKIRELLSILTPEELNTLERALCSQDEPSFLFTLEEKRKQSREERRKSRKDPLGGGSSSGNPEPSDGDDGSIQSDLTAKEIAERLEALALSFEATQATGNSSRMNVNNSASQTPVVDGSNAVLVSQSVNSICDNGTHGDSNDSAAMQTDSRDVQNNSISLFREVSLDSSDIVSAPSNVPAGSDLLVQGIELPAQFRLTNSGQHGAHDTDSDNLQSPSNLEISSEENSFGQTESSLNQDEAVNDNGPFYLNKCDSRDSGLQSEVVSNSGSMFTISSSDSNQQIILSSDSIPSPSDHNGTDSSEDMDSSDMAQGAIGVSPSHLENSSDSSATIVFNEQGSISEKGESTSDLSRLEELVEIDYSIQERSPEQVAPIPSSYSGPINDHAIAQKCIMKSLEGVSGEVPDSSSTAPEEPFHSCDISCGRTKTKHEDNALSSEDDDCQSDKNRSKSVNRNNSVTQNSSLTNEQDESSNRLSFPSDSNRLDPPQSLSIQNSNSTALDSSVSSNGVDVRSKSSSSSSMQLDKKSKISSKEDSSQSNGSVSANGVKNERKKNGAITKVKTSKKSGRNRVKKTGQQQDSAPPHRQNSKSALCPHHARMRLDSQLDGDRYHSSDTSSYTSECGDQEEIALAIEAAESATRNQVRARFRSSGDMIHRLFVCISGVADQLQTNFAGDLRNILRCVFDMNCPEPIDNSDNDKSKETTPLGAAYRAMSHAARAQRHRHSSLRRDPPTWLPDEQSNECMACQVPFSFLRRRHHCRNCGKIYCSRCSSNFVPLPHFGQDKPVRVCNRCHMFQVTHFTTE